MTTGATARSLNTTVGRVAFAALLLSAYAAQAGSLEVLRDEGFTVTVRVEHSSKPLRARALAPCMLIDATGASRLTLGADQFVRFDSTEAPQVERPYTIVVAAFDQFEKSSARRYADRVRGSLGATVRVARLQPGVRENLRDTPYGALAVCVGVFDTQGRAFASLEAIRSLYPLSTVERVKADSLPRASIRVSDVDGRTLAAMPAPITIRPLIGSLRDRSLAVGSIADAGRDWRTGGDTDIVCPGIVTIDADTRHRLTAVNRTHVDEYLRGVVPAEIGSAPFEALKAQAIASRSEALSRVDSGHYLDPLYDLCATQRTQVYGGMAKAHPLADRAIEESAYQVMLHDGSVVEAVYSANCGGVTASSEDVWTGALPYLRGKVDGATATALDLHSDQEAFRFISSSPQVFSNPTGSDVIPEREQKYFRWRERLSVAELTRSVNKSHKVGLVRDVRVVERSSTGRAKTVEIIGDKSTAKVSGYLNIRAALGGVFSTFFVVTEERDRAGRLVAVSLHGAGHGHGVGMCQTGARTMAAEGFTSREILTHYYQGVTVAAAI